MVRVGRSRRAVVVEVILSSSRRQRMQASLDLGKTGGFIEVEMEIESPPGPFLDDEHSHACRLLEV